MATRKFIGYDVFKLIVAIILLLLLFNFWGKSAPPVVPTEEVVQTEEPPMQDEGKPAYEVSQEPEEGAEEVVAPALESPAPGDQIEAGLVEFLGTAAPGSRVQISLDGGILEIAEVGDDGRFSGSTTIDGLGEHQVVLDALDAEGNIVFSSDPVTFTIIPPLSQTDEDQDTSADEEDQAGSSSGEGSDGSPSEEGQSEAPAEGEERVFCGPDLVHGEIKGKYYIVGYCDMLLKIAKFLGVTLEEILAINPDIKDPNLIYPGQKIRIPKK